MPEAQAIVTLASNLDVAAWTTLHGYTPLTGSLDPAAGPALPEAIERRHFAGGEDRNVPPAIAHPPGSELCVVPGIQHECCWQDLWPEALSRLGEAADFTRLCGELGGAIR
jgi:hypothetical protein